MKRVKQKLKSTIFKDSPMVVISANPARDYQGLPNLVQEIADYSFNPDRQKLGPFLFAVDHCFSVKGQGTVFTGTVISGLAKIDDVCGT